MAGGAFVLGSTGMCGLQMLKAVEKSASFDKVVTIGRRPPSLESPKLKAIVEKDSEKWGEIVEKEAKGFKVLMSGLSTTRGAAGSDEGFYNIDYTLNYAAAKAAKNAGVETYVLISGSFADANSRFLYIKTKGKLEDDVRALKFKRTIIFRPGLILGDREKKKSAGEEFIVSILKYTYGNFLSNITNPIYAKHIGEIATTLALEPIPEDQTEPTVRIIGARELSALGKALP